MKFKKGDIVQVWNDEKDSKNLTVYFALNDHPNAEYPHLVRTYNPNSKKTYSGIFAYSHCRHSRSDLKMDGPVWMYKIGWWLWYFPQWPDTGDMKYWKDGCTSHTVSDENEYLTSRGYRHSAHQTANKGGRMNLHGKIMNIQPDKADANKAIAEAYKIFKTKSEVLYAVYRLGHHDARHAAAELAVGIKFENCTKEGAEKGEGPPIIGEFKKGDIVECWDDDDDDDEREECEYFGFNTHRDAKYPHLVYGYKLDGTTGSKIFAYSHCRHARPNLKIDDLVWIYNDIHNTWIGRHFAGWADTGHMKYWKDGGTSHSAKTENSYFITRKYRTSPPDK